MLFLIVVLFIIIIPRSDAMPLRTKSRIPFQAVAAVTRRRTIEDARGEKISAHVKEPHGV